jgi:hypothetical protein
MHAFAQLRSKIGDKRRQRTIDRLVKPGLRSRVGPETLGFAGREPVQAVLADGTLVLYDGAVLHPGADPLQELQPQAGYRIWERMGARA